MRCASAITARITCSIRRMVRPSARLMSRNTCTIWSVSAGRARHHFVEQEQPRPRGERARDLQALAVGEGEEDAGKAALVSRLSFQYRACERSRAGNAAFPVKRADDHVVEHREAGEGLDELEGAADPGRAHLVRT